MDDKKVMEQMLRATLQPEQREAAEAQLNEVKIESTFSIHHGRSIEMN